MAIMELIQQEINVRRRPAAVREAPGGRKIVLPPRLLFDGLLRRLMTPVSYKRYVIPHVADMHEEYFSCLAKKDNAGARWALIRAHLYVIPSWVWACLGQLLARVLGR